MSCMERRTPIYLFCSQKNLKLKLERNISFEEIISAINDGQLLDVINSNKAKYKNQNIYVVYAKKYVYLVPYVKDKEGNIFLKTVIPSRKAKRQYLGGKRNEKEIKTS